MESGTSRSGRKIKPSLKRQANELGDLTSAPSNSKAVSKKTKNKASANSPASSTLSAIDHLPDPPAGGDQTPSMSSTPVQPTSDQPDVIDLEDPANNTPEDDQAKLGKSDLFLL